MSAWSRIALLAAGATAGAVATRWAASEQGRRAFGELTQALTPTSTSGNSALSPRGTSGAHTARPGISWENRLGSRLLRIAQDVKAAMDQREGELRDQLGLASPEQIRSRHSALSASATDPAAQLPRPSAHHPVDPD